MVSTASLIKKISGQIADLLKIDEKRKENPSVKATGHEKYLLKKLNRKYEQERTARGKREKERKGKRIAPVSGN